MQPFCFGQYSHETAFCRNVCKHAYGCARIVKVSNSMGEAIQKILSDIAPRFRDVRGFQLTEDSDIRTPDGSLVHGCEGDWYLIFDFGKGVVVPDDEFRRYFRLRA